RLPCRGVRANVLLVGLVHSLQCVVSSAAGVLFGFIVHERDVKTGLTRHVLQQGIAAINVGLPVAVPVGGKGVNAHLFGLLNLLAKHCRVLRGVTDINVIVGAEPWLVIGHHFGGNIRGTHALIDGAVNAGGVCSTSAGEDE